MFKNLKSLFVVPDGESAEIEGPNAEKGADTKKTTPKKTTNTTAPETSKTEGSPAAPVASKGKVTSKFMNVLLGAMEKNNLQGFDYLEFKQSLKSLENVQMDDATRFQSAFAMAQSQGATPEKLIKAAQHYKAVLKQEEDKFGQALAGQRSKQIGDKESSIKQAEAMIKEKTAKIKQLEKEIADHQKYLNKTQHEIQSAKAKVDSTKNNFVVTYQMLVRQIDADISNITKFLKKK